MITRAAARDKGTRWNKEVARYLAVSGWPLAETRARNGTADRGDVSGVAGVMIEAKNVARPRLGKFMGEVVVQTANADAQLGVVWMKVPRFSHAQDGIVAMSPGALLALGFVGGIAGEWSLPAVFANPELMCPDHTAVILLKGSGWAAMRGDVFVTMLKAGGW